MDLVVASLVVVSLVAVALVAALTAREVARDGYGRPPDRAVDDWGAPGAPSRPWAGGRLP